MFSLVCNTQQSKMLKLKHVSPEENMVLLKFTFEIKLSCSTLYWCAFWFGSSVCVRW